MESPRHDSVRAIRWCGDALELLDQRQLPDQEVWLRLHTVAEVSDAIRDMVVRGAPAIGITAAFGIVLAVRRRRASDGGAWREGVEEDLQHLLRSRPTAVNLRWAIEGARALLDRTEGDIEERLERWARGVHDEDIAANRRMGELGAALIEKGGVVLTHCNTGSLATGGYGTALGVIRSAWSTGRVRRVFADETRPWLQGSRLTAWELVRDGIPVELIADGAAAHLMRTEGVSWVIVGADRIAANGDTANKIGTYQAAIAARHHGVRFMVVAPTSTIDLTIAGGDGIPIEKRGGEEVLGCGGRRVAAEGAEAWNPVFDVTPAELIDAIVTERGVVERPSTEGIMRLFR